MANRLRVTELDFDQIKVNLKNFLKQQSEFTDYDFEGSGLNVLLDILAYNTHYNAYYLNMIANESFMDTALLRNSVVSHAKKLGYTPRSYRAPRALIDFTVITPNANTGTLTIPKGYNFFSNAIDNKIYNYVTLTDHTVGKTANNYVFTDLEIYEGQLVSYSYTHSQTSNPKQIFDIPDAQIDTTTLTVTVQQSSSNTEVIVYNLAEDVMSLTTDSKAYFLQEGQNGFYQIYFGDGIVGQNIPDGGIVNISYLNTNGDASNKAGFFVGTAPLGGYANFVATCTLPAGGGSTRETVDQIKFAAPLNYISQNRAVTKQDYIKLIQQKYPQFEAVNVWGGEENIPPVYGKVFIAAKPKGGFEITDTEKDYFLNNILKPISVLTVTPEIVDVDYNYLKMNSTIYYDPTKTTLDTNTLKTKIQAAIISFCNSNLNSFNSFFKSSALKTIIDNADSSIVSNELELFLSKRFRPDLTQSKSYVLDFGTELQRGTTLDNFYSSPNFSILDENLVTRSSFLEEIPSSFTGVEAITVTNPGINFTSTPTIEIVGDGQGATAVATIVNGKLSNIKVLTPGVGYTTAVVRITGGGGTSALAEAVLENRYGQLRISYFKPDAISNQNVKNVLNSAKNSGVMGTIDYVLGKIYINNFNPSDVDNDFKDLSINVRPKVTVFQSDKNKLLTFDTSDASTFVINLVPIK